MLCYFCFCKSTTFSYHTEIIELILFSLYILYIRKKLVPLRKIYKIVMKRIIIFLFISVLMAGCTKKVEESDRFSGVYRLQSCGFNRTEELIIDGRHEYWENTNYNSWNDSCYNNYSLLVIEKTKDNENSYILDITETGLYDTINNNYKRFMPASEWPYYKAVLTPIGGIIFDHKKLREFDEEGYKFETECYFDSVCVKNDTISFVMISEWKDYKKYKLREKDHLRIKYVAVKIK